MQLETITAAVIAGEIENGVRHTREALEAGIGAEEIYRKGLIPGMEIVGKKMQSGEYFIPEVLLSAQVMKQALEILRPTLGKAKSERALGRVVMATVEGDLHDIGKNLVIAMLEGAGFEVTDLGVNTPAKAIVAAVQERQADILGLSALLSVTMLRMKEVIESLEVRGIRKKTRVMVGGACVTQAFAEEIGADGYALDAGSAVELAKKLLVR